MSVPYDRSAALYDAIYGDKAFAAEAEAVRAIVERTCPHARTLLDVGCGTGGHLQWFRRWLDVEGLDRSPAMLEVARTKVPDATLHVGDLRGFAIDRRFDVVTCLFSAIGYVRSVEELNAAIATMVRHLAPGGLLLVEPWLTPEQWAPGRVHGSLAVDSDTCKIVRLCVPFTRDRFAVTPMHHLVATLDGVEHFVETHELFLAEPAELAQAFAAAGLHDVEHVCDVLVRGLWLGRAPDHGNTRASVTLR